MKDKDTLRTKSLQENPGAAVDKADHGKTTMKEVDQETTLLNNNPRSNDDKMP